MCSAMSSQGVHDAHTPLDPSWELKLLQLLVYTYSEEFSHIKMMTGKSTQNAPSDLGG